MLLTPGPTMLAPATRKFLSELPDIHHREEPFPQYWDSIREKLQRFFEIENSIPFIRACSGTGVMEAAVCNIVRPGDKVLVLNHGAFGDRFHEILKTFGAVVTEVKSEWGHPIHPEAVSDSFERNKGRDFCAVFMQATDTSTGVLNDVEAIACIIKESSDALIVVDAIFEAAVSRIPMAAWGIDLLACGSQKAFALLPGLAFLLIDKDAFKRIADLKLRQPAYYWDVVKDRDATRVGGTPFTPPTNMIAALDYVLDKYLKEGPSVVYERNRRNAHFTREALGSLGLSPFPRSQPSNGITIVDFPETTCSATDVVTALRKNHNIIIANGQLRLKGKVFRFAHFGAITLEDHLMPFLHALKETLNRLGWRPPTP